MSQIGLRKASHVHLFDRHPEGLTDSDRGIAFCGREFPARAFERFGQETWPTCAGCLASKARRQRGRRRPVTRGTDRRLTRQRGMVQS